MAKVRFVVLICLLALIAALVPVASAQGNVDLNCLGLSAADCALLTKAGEGPYSSFSQSWKFKLSVTGTEALGEGGDVSVSAEGSGPFVLDPAAMAAGDMTKGLAMAMDIAGRALVSGEEQSGTVSIVIADGVLYVKDPASGKWQGAKLEELFKEGGDMFSSLGVPLDQVGGLASGDPSAAAGAIPPELAALAGQMPDITKYVKQVRSADETVDGTNSAVFALSLDFGALLNSPELAKLVSTAASSAAGADGSGGDAAQMAMMFPMLAKGINGEVKFTRWISQDDSLLRRFVLDITGQFDMAALMGGSASGGTTTPPINLNISLAVDLTGINNTSAPTAPEGATIVPASEFGKAFGG